MIFRQLFDRDSYTYTYLLGNEVSGEALIIDPVLSKVARYLQLLDELGLRLVKVLDTHVHADHISGMGCLRDRTRCITVMGEESAIDVVSQRVSDGDPIRVEGIELKALHTPGHTADSYSFVMEDRVFTGDALFIRGTGRTDFQQGNSAAAYDSLFNKLLRLPDETLVYPAHDYKGDTVSTIGEEKAHNPRLQVQSVEEYADIMANLKLASPKMMDVAVPANIKMGLSQEELEKRGMSVTCEQALALHEQGAAEFVDLREVVEREERGIIPGSVHAPYDEVGRAEGVLEELSQAGDKKLVVCCAYGERSAMIVQQACKLGITCFNLRGGLNAWRRAGGPLNPAS